MAERALSVEEVLSKNKFPQVWQAENTGGWDISYSS
jgi:hypothetical protein